jgi:hypothetical protein
LPASSPSCSWWSVGYELSAFPRDLLAGADADRALELAAKVRYAKPG